MRARDGGFSLLEALVAFVIAALALGALAQGAGGGILAARVAAHTQEALSRARSRLATIGHGTPLAETEQSGDDGGGFTWRMRITPVLSEPPPRPTTDDRPGLPRAVLYGVSVAVAWRMDGPVHEVILNTERLGQIASPAAR